MSLNGERLIRSFRSRLERLDRCLDRMKAAATELGSFEAGRRVARLDAERLRLVELVRQLRGAGLAGRARRQDEVERALRALEEAFAESKSGAC